MVLRGGVTIRLPLGGTLLPLKRTCTAPHSSGKCTDQLTRVDCPNWMLLGFAPTWIVVWLRHCDGSVLSPPPPFGNGGRPNGGACATVVNCCCDPTVSAREAHAAASRNEEIKVMAIFDIVVLR